MAILRLYKTLLKSARREFADIVVSAQILFLPTGDPHKLRLDIADSSLLDVFVAVSGRYPASKKSGAHLPGYALRGIIYS